MCKVALKLEGWIELDNYLNCELSDFQLMCKCPIDSYNTTSLLFEKKLHFLQKNNIFIERISHF